MGTASADRCGWMRVLRLGSLLLAAACFVDPVPPTPDGPVDDDGDGFTAADGDCDDRDPAVFPGAQERCDGVDEDCDGEVDNDPVDPLSWWVDADGDGYGDRSNPAFACSRPPGTVADSGDCDDASPTVNPGVAEVCNGIDDDCDRLVDDADPDTLYDAAHTWAPDRDGDGWGDAAATPVFSCGEPPAHVADRSDCDDARADVSPDGTEVCGDADEDCDGLVDDADPSRQLDGAPWWFPDGDGDGIGAGAPLQACAQPAATSAVDGDCDDADRWTYPGAPELCDGRDNDCGGADESGVASFLDPAGNWTDRTADLAAGTADAPATVVLDEDGTLQVCAGTWYVHLTVDADVTVIGDADPERVVLSAAGAGRVVTVVDANAAVELTGLTLEQGAADEGGAVWMVGGDLVIRESILWLHRSEGNGGAIWREDGATTITDTELRACTAGDRGGALYLDGGDFVGTGLVIRDHEATTSGGALHAEGTDLLVARTEISGNQAGTDGGALAIRNADVLLDEVALLGNVADDGAGGGVHASEVALTLSSSLVEGNLASSSGGGMWVSGGTLDLDDAELRANDAATGDGGGAVLVALTAWLDDVAITGNTARERGGGLLLDDTVLDGTALEWDDNTPADLHVLPLDRSYAGTDALTCDADGCR